MFAPWPVAHDIVDAQLSTCDPIMQYERNRICCEIAVGKPLTTGLLALSFDPRTWQSRDFFTWAVSIECSVFPVMERSVRGIQRIMSRKNTGKTFHCVGESL